MIQDYLIRSVIYFVILQALTYINLETHPSLRKDEKYKPSIKGLVYCICISIVPFLRFIVAFIFAIILLIPDNKLKEMAKKQDTTN